MNRRKINSAEIQRILNKILLSVSIEKAGQFAELVDLLKQLPPEKRYQWVLKPIWKEQRRSIKNKLISNKLDSQEKRAVWKKIMASILETLFLQVLTEEEWASYYIERLIAEKRKFVSATEWKSKYIFMPIWADLSAEEKRKLVFDECEEKDVKRISALMQNILVDIDNRFDDDWGRDIPTDDTILKTKEGVSLPDTPDERVERKEEMREMLQQLDVLKKICKMRSAFSPRQLRIIRQIEETSQSSSDIEVAIETEAQALQLDASQLKRLWYRYEMIDLYAQKEEMRGGTSQS
ncbi:TPA: hypothetical protein EYP66_15780 [Candidatus Poribacteria bacterium]|nr:hypothetical protein [Candidatus Poribacteria bacterium]